MGQWHSPPGALYNDNAANAMSVKYVLELSNMQKYAQICTNMHSMHKYARFAQIKQKTSENHWEQNTILKGN